MKTYAEIEELALKFQETGDNNVFASFYDDLNKRFKIYLFSYYKNIKKHNVDEVCSDAMYNIWNKIHQFDLTRGRFSTWAFSILRNAALHMIKHQNKYFEYCDNYDNNNIINEDDEEEHQKNIEVVLSALEEIPYPLRSFLDDKYINGLSNPEIALKYNMPIQVVKNRIHKGLLAIKAIIRKKDIMAFKRKWKKRKELKYPPLS
jgi:RNA polymerase sigma-70 factor (ECF subfamily)